MRRALRTAEDDGTQERVGGIACVDHRDDRRGVISRREYGVSSGGRRDSRIGDAASTASRVRGRRHRACRDPRRGRRFPCGHRVDHQPRRGTRVSRCFRFDARAARLAAQRRPWCTLPAATPVRAAGWHSALRPDHGLGTHGADRNVGQRWDEDRHNLRPSTSITPVAVKVGVLRRGQRCRFRAPEAFAGGSACATSPAFRA